MSYHDHMNRHRVSRSMRRKRRLEAHEAQPPGKDIQEKKEQQVNTVSNTNVSVLEGRGLRDNMQPEVALREPPALLEARTAGEPPSPTVVTVFQVLAADAQTIGQFTGVTLPFTLSDPAYGSLTISAPTNSADTASASETSASPAYTSLTAETPSLTQTDSSSASTSTGTSSSQTSQTSQTSSSTLTSSTSTSSSTSSQSTTSGSTTTTATSSSSTSTSSSVSSTTTGTSTTSTSSSSPTGDQGSGAASGKSHNATPKIVGGVVGGVVGLIILLLIALFLLYRWKKSKRKAQGAAAVAPAPSNGAATSAPPMEQQSPAPPRSATTSSERSDRSRTSPDALFTAAYLAPAFMRRWRNSTMTTQTDNTEASERGFQKVSGRKIPSVLHSGGDGYGGNLGRTSPPDGEPSTRASPPSPSPAPPTRPYGAPLDVTRTRESDESDGVVVVRPSPARTPHPGAVDISVADIPAPSTAVSQQTDVVGRSRPSLDGSRGSRFTESI